MSALSLGYGVYAGEAQRSEQKKSVRRQEQAQREAEQDAAVQTRVADEEANRARQKQPDLGVLLNDIGRGFRPNNQSVRADQLLLGRPGLLGV